MPIGWKRGWVIIVMALLATTGCTAICSTCAASDRGIAASNNESQGPTVEIRGRSREGSYVPKAVDVHVTLGNVVVNVVEPGDSNHVLILAKNVMLTDNRTEAQFISETVDFDRAGVEFIEIAPGLGAPELETRIYVRKEIPLKIIADNGSIQINGNVGAITAQVSGKDRGITVDGAHTQLTLRAENGPIQITAEDVNVDASTGAGDILLVGKLRSGTSYFTTTSGSNITVVMPRFDTYSITATTRINTIDVQFPATGDFGANPVCGTFNSGPPYVIRADDRDHNDRGQVTINKGDERVGGPAELVGIVTPNYFAFHSTARNVLLEAPGVSEFFIETLFGNPVGAPTAEATQPATATPQSPPQTAPSTPQLSPTEQAMIDSFQGTPIPAAQPLPGQNQSSASPATGGEIMYSVHCPVKDRATPRVTIFASSNGGHIRIYQNLP